MKRKSSFHNKMLQFRYEHKNFDNTFSRLRKSAEEVNKTLNKMSQNDAKKGKINEIEKNLIFLKNLLTFKRLLYIISLALRVMQNFNTEKNKRICAFSSVGRAPDS